MNNENYISEEVFEELVNGLDFIERLTLYGRKSLKYHIKRLQEENQKLKLQYCERTDCSGRIGNSKKVEQLQTENEQLKENNLAMQEEMARTWAKLQQKEDIINKAIDILKEVE